MHNPVNGCELEALRNLLFFSPSEAANLIGGASEQAWRRWEQSKKPVPEDVSIQILALVDWRQREIDRHIHLFGLDVHKVHCLPWFYSIDDYLACTGNQEIFFRPKQSVAAALLAEFPKRLILIRFNLESYRNWLELASLPDCEQSQLHWALSLHQTHEL